MMCVEYGHPLILQELERQKLKKGEVRIRTQYAGINYAGNIVEWYWNE